MEKLVHVMPLGWEYDRAVLPAIRMHAHKVYLLCNPESVPQQARFYRKVREALEGAKIEVELVTVDANADFKALIREVARLVLLESRAGNRVYVNMSSGGKISAAAATVAAMAHISRGRGVIYYVEPEKYMQRKEEQERYGLSRGMKGDPITLPIFDLKLPAPSHRVVLQSLLAAPGYTLTYRDIIQVLRKHGIKGFADAAPDARADRATKNRLNVTLNKRILQRIYSDGWVDILADGRARSVRLTSDGEYIASLCGTP